MATSGHSPLEHVIDHDFLELPWITDQFPYVGEKIVHLRPIHFLGYSFQITRFMVMELLAALLIILIVVPLARHVARNKVTRGLVMNMFESITLFVRDGIARPAIGGHAADKFLPYLWTVFFFVLFNNLLGMIPGGASATGNINVTAVLAILTLGTVVTAGVKEYGAAGFFKNLVPHLDVPWILKPVLIPLLFVIELAGLLIKHVVLAVRLFANMMAGHIVLAVILGFIGIAGSYIYVIAPASILGVVALSLLELFVAFLQAYIFTFLSALFIGSAVHPH